jgi:hypothetical protein
MARHRMYVRATFGELHAERVQRHQPFGSDAATCAHYWREHALALHLPRHFPEYVSDADIEATVRHCVATERLPWEVDVPPDFGCYKWSESYA